MRAQVADLTRTKWGSDLVVSRGRSWYPAQLPGFLARVNEETAGLVTYHIEAEQCEVVTLHSWVENIGIGTSLLKEVTQCAAEARCRRVWLITTNDNLHALGFYQKRGFRMVAVYPNALAVSRQLKPEIPLIGFDNIPLRDEIELELPLG